MLFGANLIVLCSLPQKWPQWLITRPSRGQFRPATGGAGVLLPRFRAYLKEITGISFESLAVMETYKVKTCFTITFTDEQYTRAKYYVDDMKRHPNRMFWRGKEGKSDDELIIEQIAHRILSGFYHDDPMAAARHIMRMDSSVQLK
jgi:hypothetical protein